MTENNSIYIHHRNHIKHKIFQQKLALFALGQ